jgi:formylglycine-generating enzyme required for sulfatase activity
MVIHCVECHLPPGGVPYAMEKARLGIRDAWSTAFKDTDSIDWEERSVLEHARTHTFRESCLECHPNLFPIQLSDEGEEAHLHYERKADEIRCLNCHLHVGHYDPDATDEIDFGIVETVVAEVYEEPAEVEGFVDYEERIPGTSVSFQMVAVPGGTFLMGSPETEDYREPDEGPVHEVTVSPFWMAKVEVSWDEFEAWYRDTRAEGRTDTRTLRNSIGQGQRPGSGGGPEVPGGRAAASGGTAAQGAGVDAITGATPPYVPPDQGWGKGSRPAITMTHHAAVQYTRWLSEKTGREYRLPTEAEWEYAARGGTSTPYFFEGSPRDYDPDRLIHKVFGYNTDVLDSFVVHAENSGARTQPPEDVETNPFGLVNMLGNVREFTLDWYAEETYSQRSAGGPVLDPRGPEAGTEHVIRGGSFRNSPVDMRSAARDFTRTDACLVTDPQIPKSIWWYSDCNDIGFRIVRVFEAGEPGSAGPEGARLEDPGPEGRGPEAVAPGNTGPDNRKP